jgi:Est1 DNA/RNA binding domain
MLLRVLQSELDTPVRSVKDSVPNNAEESVSTVARHILPALKNYSSWLQSNAVLLGRFDFGDHASSVEVLLREMWSTYATTLTLLNTSYPNYKAPLNYLLEEDEETLGFIAFEQTFVRGRYYLGGFGATKPMKKTQKFETAASEGLVRIHELLTVGFILSTLQVGILDYGLSDLHNAS